MKIFVFCLTNILGAWAMAGNLETSVEFFNKLSINSMNLVDQFYDKDIVFHDPIHKIKGSEQMKKYYEGLYKNVESIRFEYKNPSEAGSTVTLPWVMYLKTKSLNDGKEFSVDGVSLITFSTEGKAVYHRDYFDLGEFVYEKVPVLKNIIFYIKRKLAGEN